MSTSVNTLTITTDSKRSRRDLALKLKRRVDALITARFALRTTSATNIAAGLLPIVLDEVDGLIAQGVEYIYFIDEIFLPNKELLEGLAERAIKFGVQTRIDLWSEAMLDLLGRAGCVSIEAGVEINHRRRSCGTRQEVQDVYGRTGRTIDLRQAACAVRPSQPDRDGAGRLGCGRCSSGERLLQHGVWANKPVPLYPYPGSPDYTKRWGQPDDRAWERAHDYYLTLYDQFSDIQDQRPVPLTGLELPHACSRE